MKPILFNTDMIRAILDDRKTETRRAIKPQPDKEHTCPFGFCIDGDKKHIKKFGFGTGQQGGNIFYVKPPCRTGDILYVRETWDNIPVKPDGSYCGYDNYYYRADGDLRPDGWRGNWKPSIHMPKRAARIFLHVTDVRVERLQDISYEQAEAEGTGDLFLEEIACEEEHYNIPFEQEKGLAKDQFAHLWDSTITKKKIAQYGWDANPWIWVTEFKRIDEAEIKEGIQCG